MYLMFGSGLKIFILNVIKVHVLLKIGIDKMGDKWVCKVFTLQLIAV